MSFILLDLEAFNSIIFSVGDWIFGSKNRAELCFDVLNRRMKGIKEAPKNFVLFNIVTKEKLKVTAHKIFGRFAAFEIENKCFLLDTKARFKLCETLDHRVESCILYDNELFDKREFKETSKDFESLVYQWKTSTVFIKTGVLAVIDSSKEKTECYGFKIKSGVSFYDNFVKIETAGKNAVLNLEDQTSVSLELFPGDRSKKIINGEICSLFEPHLIPLFACFHKKRILAVVAFLKRCKLKLPKFIWFEILNFLYS